MTAATCSEPYRLPAGILAAAVHGVFFALLYFGFAWQTQTSGTMSVELWQSMPDMASPPVPSRVEEKVPPQAEKQIAPEIAMPDKKKTEARPAPRIVEGIRAESSGRISGAIASDQTARERAAQEAAVGRMVDEHIARIVGKIRGNIVMPPDVADDARAEFSVTLLPGGAVLSARLTRSSGNAVYDSAVERAILKSQPLPLPADVALFNRFRELRLVFRPVE